MPDADPQTPAPEEEAFLDDAVILVVDDNAQNLELLQAYLEALPCEIHTATDGQEAIAQLDQIQPDLILLDVMMPRMSGFEVCRKIKANPATRSIPVMMVTALNEIGDIERGVESGTDEFLSKPVNKLELLTRAKNLLRVSHLRRALDRSEARRRDVAAEGEPGPSPAPDPGAGPLA